MIAPWRDTRLMIMRSSSQRIEPVKPRFFLALRDWDLTLPANPVSKPLQREARNGILKDAELLAL